MLIWSREDSMKEMGAAQFKATCLAVMDEVQSRNEPVLITKNGRPVVRVVPAELDEEGLEAFYFGPIEMHGDIVAPASDLDDWKALK